MDYLKKAKVLIKYFNMYGYGNFDLTVYEIALILKILNAKETDKKLKQLYEELEKSRMG
jgi:hypothetical protein|tara:strand:- start:1921 stop:2097 length:177 start_codon:yes stop_codon:yes gene_type:complete